MVLPSNKKAAMLKIVMHSFENWSFNRFGKAGLIGCENKFLFGNVIEIYLNSAILTKCFKLSFPSKSLIVEGPSK